MKNEVVTFNKFNNGMRRPNHRKHLRLCGYRLVRSIQSNATQKPREIALAYLDQLTELTGQLYSGVTKQVFSLDKDTGYELWIKEKS